MSYTVLTTKLGEVLEAVKNASWSKLATWYSYPDPESNETPYATIDTVGSSEQPLDTNSNLVTYEYRIRIISRELSTGRQVLEETLRKVVDDVNAELRKRTNILFGGASVKSYSVETQWWANFWNSPSVRYADIKIMIEEIYQIS